MTEARLRTGRAAEDLCAARVTALGWRVLDRNWRARFGELDLVALDGRCLVFVEVKAGHAGLRDGPERPALAVGPAKMAKLRRLAEHWIAVRGRPLRFEDARFDVVGVSFGQGGELLDYEHLRDAFR